MTPDEGGVWVRDIDSLPDHFDGCEAVEPETNRPMLVLDTFVSARSKGSGYSANDRTCNQSVTPVIIKKQDKARFVKAFKKSNLGGDFRNPKESNGSAFLLEYPWHSAWSSTPKAFEPLDIRHSLLNNLEPHYPYRPYSHENSSYDKSTVRSLSVNLPSALLIDELSLTLDIETMKYIDENGKPIFYDPGIHYNSMSSVVVDKAALSKWLDKNDYVLVTGITLMKQYTQDNHGKFMGELTDCQLISYDGKRRSGHRWSILTEIGPKDSVFCKAFKM